MANSSSNASATAARISRALSSRNSSDVLGGLELFTDWMDVSVSMAETSGPQLLAKTRHCASMLIQRPQLLAQLVRCWSHEDELVVETAVTNFGLFVMSIHRSDPTALQRAGALPAFTQLLGHSKPDRVEQGLLLVAALMQDAAGLALLVSEPGLIRAMVRCLSHSSSNVAKTAAIGICELARSEDGAIAIIEEENSVPAIIRMLQQRSHKLQPHVLLILARLAPFEIGSEAIMREAGAVHTLLHCVDSSGSASEVDAMWEVLNNIISWVKCYSSDASKQQYFSALVSCFGHGDGYNASLAYAGVADVLMADPGAARLLLATGGAVREVVRGLGHKHKDARTAANTITKALVAMPEGLVAVLQQGGAESLLQHLQSRAADGAAAGKALLKALTASPVLAAGPGRRAARKVAVSSSSDRVVYMLQDLTHVLHRAMNDCA